MKKILFVLFSLILASCGGGGDSSSGHSALCNDGTFSDSKNCSGTCSSHGGVKEWYVSCGSSASKFSSSIINGDANNNVSVWVGAWTNKEDRSSGTVRLNIGDRAITGVFLNTDNTLNSNLHSYLDEDGSIGFLVDVRQPESGVFIEYPAYVSFDNVNTGVVGSISVQTSGSAETRHVELNRE